MLRVLPFWLIVAAILGNANALAQDYPTGPVKIILSNSAGSSPDIVARIVADRLSKALGQQVFVENKPGGDSVLGAVLAARAPADGYTLYLTFNDALVSNRFRFNRFRTILTTTSLQSPTLSTVPHLS
jgi:tripartite-type tricarboxylate transporter receptor subunit TctC